MKRTQQGLGRLYYLLFKRFKFSKRRQRLYYLFFKPFTREFMRRLYKYGFLTLLTLILIMISLTVLSETPIENEDKKTTEKDICWYVTIGCDDI